MKLGLIGISGKLDTRRWVELPLNFVAIDDSFRHDLHLRDLPVNATNSEALFLRAADRLLRYQIFPATRMTFELLNVGDDGHLRVGSVVVQRIRIGPITIESATRVSRLVNQEDATSRMIGFRYDTIVGHPECGWSEFRVRLDRQAPRMSLEIETRSRPGSALTRLGAPVTRALQQRFTQEALADFAAHSR